MNPERRRHVPFSIHPFSAQSRHNSSLRTSRVPAISIQTSSASRSNSFMAIRHTMAKSAVTMHDSNLRVVCEPVFIGDIREREHLLSATITVATANEIKQLFLIYQAAGVCFHQALKKEPWGGRTFIVSDPDGNLVLFAGPAD